MSLIEMVKDQSFLTIKEAAQFLSVGVTTLRQWDKAGVLVAGRTPGGHRRYSINSLKRFISF